MPPQWLDELRVKKIILLKDVKKSKRRNNAVMFVTDEEAFHKKSEWYKEI